MSEAPNLLAAVPVGHNLIHQENVNPDAPQQSPQRPIAKSTRAGTPLRTLNGPNHHRLSFISSQRCTPNSPRTWPSVHEGHEHNVDDNANEDDDDDEVFFGAVTEIERRKFAALKHRRRTQIHDPLVSVA